MSMVSTYYLLWLLPSLNLLAGGFITLLCCNRAPVLNLCSLSVILHSKSYKYSACQWAVEFIWLPSTTFHCNSCLPPQEGTLISSCVCFKMNQTVVEHVVYWLDIFNPIQTSMTNDRHIALADHFVFLWVLVWSLAIVQHVCLSLFAWVSTNQWATKNSSTLILHPGYAFVGYSPIFPDWSQISDLQRAIASKAAETVTEIDEDTVYAMLCTGGLVHKHIT